MAKFNGYTGNITPNVTGANFNNFSLLGTATIRATVQEVVFGGGASSSTPMETTIQRVSSAGTTPPANLNVTRLDTSVSTPGHNLLATANATWATGPTRVAGALFGTMWNSYGGVIRWLAAPGEEFDIALSTALGVACVPISGTGASSYSGTWTEF